MLLMLQAFTSPLSPAHRVSGEHTGDLDLGSSPLPPRCSEEASGGSGPSPLPRDNRPTFHCRVSGGHGRGWGCGAACKLPPLLSYNEELLALGVNGGQVESLDISLHLSVLRQHPAREMSENQLKQKFK